MGCTINTLSSARKRTIYLLALTGVLCYISCYERAIIVVSKKILLRVQGFIWTHKKGYTHCIQKILTQWIDAKKVQDNKSSTQQFTDPKCEYRWGGGYSLEVLGHENKWKAWKAVYNRHVLILKDMWTLGKTQWPFHILAYHTKKNTNQQVSFFWTFCTIP